MNAKHILTLAQDHRKEPSLRNYATLANAIRAMDEELNILRDASNHWRATFDKQLAEIGKLRNALDGLQLACDWVISPDHAALVEARAILGEKK